MAQQPVAASKSKKNERKKTEVKTAKTKKVASISLLGLFFFIMLFGGLVPRVVFKSGYVSDRWFNGQGGGSVWPVNGHSNGSERVEEVRFPNGRFGISDRNNYERGRKLGEEMDERERKDPNKNNASEPLTASLYVPRNDKLVKIDGNLIIHSIMASEKAVASQDAQEKKDKSETGLAITKDLDSALAIPEVGRNRGQHPKVYRVSSEQRRALSSGSVQPKL